MDRLLQMLLRLFLRRGLRQWSRSQRRRGPAGPQDAAARETGERMRQTQRITRRFGR